MNKLAGLALLGTLITLTGCEDAKEVKEEKISNAEFTIPSDYESMTEEEFKKQMGGGQ